jgi:hypothetical protein
MPRRSIKAALCLINEKSYTLKTKLLSLLACLLMLAACTKKETEPEPTGPCRLIEVKMEGADPWGNWQQPFYDEQGRLAGVKSPLEFGVNRYSIVNIGYDSEGRRKEMTHEIPDSETLDKVLYRYDNKGQLATVEYLVVNKLDGISIPGGSFVLTYSGDKLSSIVYRAIINGREEDHRVYKYTYSGNALVKREEYDYDNPEANRVVTLLTYDDKKRPTYIGLMPELAYSRVFIVDFLMPTGEHNVLSYAWEYSQNGQERSSQSYQNTYTYNSQGYPVKQVQKLQSGDENRFNYTYACD